MGPAEFENETTVGGQGDFSVTDLRGSFAFKFEGFSVRDATLYRLVGVGVFDLDDQGKLTGRHQSSITPLQGQNARLSTARYDLTGQVVLQNDGTGSATIAFRATDPGPLNLDGTFFVVIGGSVDRLWFISSGSTIPPDPSGGEATPADELVSLEAVRITAR
jgi:hypothetical protein